MKTYRTGSCWHDWKRRARGISRCLWLHSRTAKTDGGCENQAVEFLAKIRRPLPRSCIDRSVAGPVQISPQRLQSIGVRSGEVKRKWWRTRFAPLAVCAVDESDWPTCKFGSGVYPKSLCPMPHIKFHTGQPLFTFYSPDLVATEREYLVAKQISTDGTEHGERWSPLAQHHCSTRLRSVSSSGVFRKREIGQGWNPRGRCNRKLGSGITGLRHITERKRLAESRGSAGDAPL